MMRSDPKALWEALTDEERFVLTEIEMFGTSWPTRAPKSFALKVIRALRLIDAGNHEAYTVTPNGAEVLRAGGVPPPLPPSLPRPNGGPGDVVELILPTFPYLSKIEG